MPIYSCVDNRNYALGNGYLSLQDELKAPVLDTNVGITTVPHEMLDFTLDSFSSSLELYTYFGASLWGSYNSLEGSLEGRVDFVRSTFTTSYSAYFLIDLNFVIETQQLSQQHLSQQAEELVPALGAEEFCNRFGDEAIVALTYGARVSAIIEMQCGSVTEQEDLRVRIRGQVASYAGGLELAQAMRQIVTNQRATVRLLQHGGIGSPPRTIDELLTLTEVFINNARQRPRVVKFTTNYVDGCFGWPSTLRRPSASESKRVVVDLFNKRLETQRGIDDVAYIRSNLFEFGSPSETELEIAATTLGTFSARLDRAARRRLDRPFDAAHATTPRGIDDVRAIRARLPKRVCSVRPSLLVRGLPDHAEWISTANWEWCGVDNVPLVHISAELSPSLDDVSLVYYVEFDDLGAIGYADDGRDGEPIPTAPRPPNGHGRRIKSLRVSLEGAMAHYYRVFYEANYISSGTSGEQSNGRLITSPRPWPENAIDKFRIRVEALAAPRS